ncbi:hypothetical protein HDV00_010615, partial [Rhizophlyctis rosea]
MPSISENPTYWRQQASKTLKVVKQHFGLYTADVFDRLVANVEYMTREEINKITEYRDYSVDLATYQWSVLRPLLKEQLEKIEYAEARRQNNTITPHDLDPDEDEVKYDPTSTRRKSSTPSLGLNRLHLNEDSRNSTSKSHKRKSSHANSTEARLDAQEKKINYIVELLENKNNGGRRGGGTVEGEASEHSSDREFVVDDKEDGSESEGGGDDHDEDMGSVSGENEVVLTSPEKPAPKKAKKSPGRPKKNKGADVVQYAGAGKAVKENEEMKEKTFSDDGLLTEPGKEKNSTKKKRIATEKQKAHLEKTIKLALKKRLEYASQRKAQKEEEEKKAKEDEVRRLAQEKLRERVQRETKKISKVEKIAEPEKAETCAEDNARTSHEEGTTHPKKEPGNAWQGEICSLPPSKEISDAQS